MNTTLSVSVLIDEKPGVLFFQKLLISSLVIALLFALLPVPGVLAAPASGKPAIDSSTFEKEWSNKVQKTTVNGIFYQRVRVYPADFKDPNELAQAHEYLNNYGAALRSAQRIVINRAGFDERGRVTNVYQADQSLKDLAENLRLMRVMQQKLDALEGNYRLLPVGTTTSTASQ